MYTGDPSTAINAYPLNNAPWLIPKSSSAHSAIGPLTEDDEEEPQIGFMSATRDNEQSLSSRLLSQDAHDRILNLNNSISNSLSDSASSASPAAAFLSFFHSPTPAPENALKPDDESNIVAGYTLGPIIGYGSSSIIRRASSSSGTVAAVKIVRRADLVKAGNAPQARRRLQHEASVWATLTHEHILPLFSTVHTTYADFFFTLYCPAGSLFDILKRDGRPALPQDDAGMMFRQVVRGLRYLHEDVRYVHRDMKLENVLVDEMGLCKIGDFGMTRRIGSPDDDSDEEEDPAGSAANLSVPAGGTLHRAMSLAAPSRRGPKGNFEVGHPVMRHSSARHRNSTSTTEPPHTFQPGSLPYAAPEILLPQTVDASRPNPSQDIWALGVMLYALLTGRLPFTDSFEPRLQMKIINGAYQMPEGIGRGTEKILQGCLEKSVADRWTIAMVDEVAWGVGWGSEGDLAEVAQEDNAPTPCVQTASSRSKSRSRRPAELAIPEDGDWQRTESPSRSSREAASRRSTSRVQRSLSRAPVLTPNSRQNSSRTRRSPSRSGVSRTRSQASAGLASEMTSSSIATASSSSSFDVYHTTIDSYALEVSPSPPSSLQRSRGAPHHHNHHNQHYHTHNDNYHSTSRSPSPSMVPATPPDGAIVTSPTLEHPDEMHLDLQSSRGRPAIRADRPGKPLTPVEDWLALRGALNLTLPSSEDVTGSEDVLMGAAGMRRSDSMTSEESLNESDQVYAVSVGSGSDSVAPRGLMDSLDAGWRATSSPPTAVPRTPLGLGVGMQASSPTALGVVSVVGVGDPFLSVGAVTARSRSVAPGC